MRVLHVEQKKSPADLNHKVYGTFPLWAVMDSNHRPPACQAGYEKQKTHIVQRYLTYTILRDTQRDTVQAFIWRHEHQSTLVLSLRLHPFDVYNTSLSS